MSRRLVPFLLLQLNQLMSEITLGELTIFGEESKLDTLLGNQCCSLAIKKFAPSAAMLPPSDNYL